MNMRVYYEYIKNSFKEYLAYRFEYFTGIIQTLLSLMVQLYLWNALMGRSGPVSTNSGIVTLEDMVTYVLVSTLISSLARSRVIYDINERVRNGQISADLIRPVNFIGYMFSRTIGRSFFNLIFQFLPVLVIGIVFLDINFPSIPNLLFFGISAINAMIILFLITFCLGLLAFWYMYIWQVDMLLGTAFELFSGGWIPLWFFPSVLFTISSFLPFRLVYFIPISIFLGRLEVQDCWFMILQQVIWIIIFYGITRIIWNAAIKKLVFQGG